MHTQLTKRATKNNGNGKSGTDWAAESRPDDRLLKVLGSGDRGSRAKRNTLGVTRWMVNRDARRRGCTHEQQQQKQSDTNITAVLSERDNGGKGAFTAREPE